MAYATGHDVLAELRRNQDRPYYDAEADAAARSAYYEGLRADASPEQRFRFFSELLKRTHTDPLGYSPARHVYPWVELQPDKETLVNIYSGEESDAAKVIERDLELENQREAALERLRVSRRGEEGSAAYRRAVDEIERQFMYNCEHVVPQSWFNKKEPMRGDLHHLFACTPRCNSFRGNIPYFEFTDWEERVMGNCGRRETDAFEPKEGKFKVARATLYFLLRYPGTVKRDRYSSARVETLVAWHGEQAPGEYEQHRNAAIHELQGNRNPLIDFPELGSAIDFEAGLGG